MYDLTFSVHFAYNVVFAVIVSEAKLNACVHAESLYHPANVNVYWAVSVFVGAVGCVAFPPSSTSCEATVEPPFESKVTVYLVTSPWFSPEPPLSSILSASGSGPSHDAIPKIAVVANKAPNKIFLFFISIFLLFNSPKRMLI